MPSCTLYNARRKILPKSQCPSLSLSLSLSLALPLSCLQKGKEREIRKLMLGSCRLMEIDHALFLFHFFEKERGKDKKIKAQCPRERVDAERAREEATKAETDRLLFALFGFCGPAGQRLFHYKLSSSIMIMSQTQTQLLPPLIFFFLRRTPIDLFAALVSNSCTQL